MTGKSLGGITLLSGLFSRLCLACREPSGVGDLCPVCDGHPVWSRSAEPLLRGEIPVRFAFYDEGPAGALFRIAKNRGNRRALEVLFGRMNAPSLLPRGARLLAPVPPSRSRLIARGLSVPDSLAWRLSSGSGVPCRFSALRRTRDDPQKRKSRLERAEAFHSSRFAVDPREMARWPREGIVLVDDLVVTGWTLRSLRGLLEQEGAEVSGMVSLLFREKWKDDRRF